MKRKGGIEQRAIPIICIASAVLMTGGYAMALDGCCQEVTTVVCVDSGFDPNQGFGVHDCWFHTQCDAIECPEPEPPPGPGPYEGGGPGGGGGGGNTPLPADPQFDTNNDKKMDCWKNSVASSRSDAYTTQPNQAETPGWAPDCGTGNRGTDSNGDPIEHDGRDMPCDIGDAVRAVHSGTIEKSGWDAAAGYYIWITYKSSDGAETYRYIYQHLADITGSVSPGVPVGVGAVIGACGCTGSSCHPGSDGSGHLHLGIGKKVPKDQETTTDGFRGQCADSYMPSCP